MLMMALSNDVDEGKIERISSTIIEKVLKNYPQIKKSY